MSDFPEPQKKPERKLNYKERVKAGLQRGGLNPVSKKQQQKNNEYNKAINQDTEKDYICARHGAACRSTLTRHHYKGRQYITDYIYLCQEFHDKIHANSRWSKDEGWLWPEYDGKEQNPNQKIPWQ